MRAAATLENLHLDYVTALHAQGLGHALVDDEAGCREDHRAVIEVEDAREIHVLRLSDDGELARQMLIPQPNGYRPIRFGPQHGRKSLCHLQSAWMLLIGKGEGRLLALRAKKGDVDHALHRVEGKQSRHQQADRHGNSKRGRRRAHRPSYNVPQSHDCELREKRGGSAQVAQ